MSNNHGGVRKGAGAKVVPPEKRAKQRSIKATDEDWEKLDRMAKSEGVSKAYWLVKKIRAAKEKAD